MCKGVELFTEQETSLLQELVIGNLKMCKRKMAEIKSIRDAFDKSKYERIEYQAKTCDGIIKKLARPNPLIDLGLPPLEPEPMFVLREDEMLKEEN